MEELHAPHVGHCLFACVHIHGVLKPKAESRHNGRRFGRKARVMAGHGAAGPSGQR